MSAITLIPAVLTLAALAWLWPRRRSSADLVVQAILPALVPVAAAATIAGWSVRAAFISIGQTGSGGIGSLTKSMQGPAETLLVGVLGFAVVLAGALAMVALGAGPAQVAAGGAHRRRAYGGMLVGILAFAITVPVVRAADRLVFGNVGSMTALTRGSSDIALPPAPALARMTMPEGLTGSLSSIERNVTISTWGGSALCVILIVASVIGARARRDSGGTVGWPAAVTVALVCLAAAAVYGFHVWEAVRWLSALLSSFR